MHAPAAAAGSDTLRRVWRWLVVVALALGTHVGASAQALRVTATSALSFGTGSPNRNKTVAPSDAGAAVFTIQGPANAAVAVLPVTPAQLIGSAQWVRTSGWTATVATIGGTTSGIALVAGSELAITLGSDGLATLRIGATITPAMTVGSGTFSGTMTVVARQASAGLMSLTAQTTVSVTLRQPLLLTATTLDFGAVYVGTPKTIAPTDLRAFRLLADGALGASIDVTIESAPSTLTRDGGGGSLSIGTWQARSGGATCTGAATTPSIGVPITLDLTAPAGTSGRTSLCLGATVSPTAAQPAGSYSGTVVVSVRYTGA